MMPGENIHARQIFGGGEYLEYSYPPRMDPARLHSHIPCRKNDGMPQCPAVMGAVAE